MELDFFLLYYNIVFSHTMKSYGSDGCVFLVDFYFIFYGGPYDLREEMNMILLVSQNLDYY